MPIHLSRAATESSTYIIEFGVMDEDGDMVTPDTVAWSLHDMSGAIVNERENVAISPQLTMSIILQGDDLPLRQGRKLAVVVSATYTSDAGSGLVYSESIRFDVSPLISDIQ